jgi:hypothetical protein
MGSTVDSGYVTCVKLYRNSIRQNEVEMQSIHIVAFIRQSAALFIRPAIWNH